MSAELRLDLPDGLQEVWRGEALPSPVVGVLSAGAPLAGVKVQIYLVPEGTGSPRPVGPAVATGRTGASARPSRCRRPWAWGAIAWVAASAAGAGHGAARSDGQP
ncbi:MAG: hypothetical protein R3F60_26270 [bacterium]